MKARGRRLDAVWVLVGFLVGSGLSLGFRMLAPTAPPPRVEQGREARQGGDGGGRDRRPLRGAGEEIEAPWRLTVVGGRILVSDPRASVVMAVDPASGDRTDVFGTQDGRRIHAGDPVDVAPAPDGGLYVLDSDQNAVLHSASGRVTLVSGLRLRGAGPALDVPIALGVLPGGHLVVLDHRAQSLLEVDPATGDRKLLSGAGAGAGDPWLSPGDVAISPDGRVFVLDTGPSRIVEVDRRTGRRSTFLELGDVTPEACCNPLSLSVGGPGELLVTDLTLSRVVSVDLRTRARRLVADPLTGSGPRLAGALDAVRSGDGALIVASASGVLLRVDSRGDRTALSGRVPADGPLKVLPTMATVVDGRAVVCDPVGQRLLHGPAAVPLRLTELSGPARGAGPALRRPHGFTVSGGAALVADHSGTLTRIDLATGERVLVSGEGRGRGPLPRNPVDPVVTPTGGIIMLDRGTAQLLEVDPDTGDRRYVRLQRKDGGLLVRARGLAAGDRALWVWTLTGIYEVDPATGEASRVEVSQTSDAILTPGPSLALPNGSVLVAAQDLFGPGKVMRRLPDGEWRTLLSNRNRDIGLIPGMLALGASDAPDLGDVVLTSYGGQGLFVLDSSGPHLTALEPVEVDPSGR